MDHESDSDYGEYELIQNEVMISEDLICGQKYQIEFHLDRIDFRNILEEIVIKEKMKFSCIAGGYFTKLNGQLTNPGIYIFTGSNYIPSEDYLNEFLNVHFRQFRFEQLGTVAPLGILATKNVRMKNGKDACIFFTYVNFVKSDNHKIQLLNTYDLEPCKIMYSYGNNRFLPRNGSQVAEISSMTIEGRHLNLYKSIIKKDLFLKMIFLMPKRVEY